MRKYTGRFGIIEITEDELKQALGLMEIAEIKDIRKSFEKQSVIQILVAHPNMPLQVEGNLLISTDYSGMKSEGKL